MVCNFVPLISTVAKATLYNSSSATYLHKQQTLFLKMRMFLVFFLLGAAIWGSYKWTYLVILVLFTSDNDDDYSLTFLNMSAKYSMCFLH